MSNLPPLSNNSGLGNLGGSPALGSLAQSAREKHLKNARTILIVVGILTAAANGFLFYNAENEVKLAVDLEVSQGRAKGLQFDQATIAQESAKILGVVQLIYGASIALGVVFIVLGLLVKQFPVPTTVLGLILYIGANAGYAFLNPASLMGGIIIKVIIVVGLIRAVQAAIAYQKETNQIVGKPNAVGLGADL